MTQHHGGLISVGGSIDLCAGTSFKARPDVEAASWADGAGKGPAIHQCCFEVKTPQREYILDAGTPEQLKKWMASLEQSRLVWGQQESLGELSRMTLRQQL